MPAERVQIIVEATDAATGVLRGITGQFGQIGSLIEDLASPMQNWGNIAATATSLVINGLRDAVNYTEQYVNEVHNLSLASGESMEASSRLIQLMDDYGLSAQDAMTATRTLTRQGLAPTIDTIAKLADQYNRLGSAEERNNFIMKNLGRGGMEWANALSQGGDALREQANAVSDALIVTDQLYTNTREYEMAVDDLTDAWNGFKTEVGGAVLPVLTDILTHIEAIGLAEDQLKSEGIQAGTRQWFDRRQVLIDTAEAELEAGRAAKIHADQLNGVAGAAGNADDELKKLTQTNQSILSGMSSIDSADKSYEQGVKDRAKKRSQLIEEQMKLQQEFAVRQAQNLGAIPPTDTKWFDDMRTRINELEDVVAASHGKDQNAVSALAQARYVYNNALQQSITLQKNEYTDVGWFIDQQEKINDKAQEIRDLDQEGADAIKEKADATNKLVLAMLQQKMMQDGILSSDEVKFYMDTAVAMGVVKRESADAAIAASNQADELYSGFEKATQKDNPMMVTADILRGIADMDGKTVSMDVYVKLYSELQGAEPTGLTTNPLTPASTLPPTPTSAPAPTTPATANAPAPANWPPEFLPVVPTSAAELGAPLDNLKVSTTDLSLTTGNLSSTSGNLSSSVQDLNSVVNNLIAGLTASLTPTATPAYASGGSFIIPPQYGYEGFRMGGVATASAGETVTVTPKGEPTKPNVQNYFYFTVRNDNDLDYYAQEVTRRQTG